jgi:hypothetical protein
LLTRLKQVYPEARTIPPFAAQIESHLTWWDGNSSNQGQKAGFVIEDIDSLSQTRNIQPQVEVLTNGIP